MKAFTLFLSTLFCSFSLWAQTTNGKKIIKPSEAVAEALRIDLSKNKIANDTPKAEETPSEKETAKVLEQILNSIRDISVDFDFDITFVDKFVNSKAETYLDIKSLNLNAYVQFKDDLIFDTAKEEGNGEQLNKVIPKIKITTKDMFLVSKFSVAKKSEFNIRVCYNYTYTYGNDYCDTLNDTKLLEFSINNKTFNKILHLRLKKIVLNFDKKVETKNNQNYDTYAISGSAEIYEYQTMEEKLVPVQCVFKGHYSTNPDVGFEINVKYKTKK